MRNRTIFLIVTLVVLVLLVGGGTVAAMALTHTGLMGNSAHQRMMGTQQGYPGMMGGSQQTPAQQGTPVTHGTQVTMQDSAYQPANMQVRVGTTVTWTNQDTVPHTVTFRNTMMGSGLMGSSMMTPGQSFSYMFRMPGIYQYSCTVHPSMVATVTVVS